MTLLMYDALEVCARTGGGHKKCPPLVSQVLTVIVTPLDLFAFVCPFGVIISIVFRFIQVLVLFDLFLSIETFCGCQFRYHPLGSKFEYLRDSDSFLACFQGFRTSC